MSLLLAVVSSGPIVYLLLENRAHDRGEIVQARRQNAEDRRLLNEIQQARLQSCILTYGAFPAVFRPFFRPAKLRTREEDRDIKRFLRQVAKFQARCPEQTGVTAKGRQP